MLMIRLTGAFLWMALSAAAAATSSSSITFNKDVLPVLQKNCQGCHRPGQIGPMPFLSYRETRPWAKAIKEAVLTKKMPPWFADPHYGRFSNERKLSQAEIDLLARWAENGAPEGDAKDRPAPLAFPPDGWNIQPDKIITMDQPYQVPAEA